MMYQSSVKTGTMKGLMNTTSVNGRNYKPGDIVLAKIAFAEAQKNGVKRRPALVVSSHHHNKSRRDLVLLKISSKPVRDKNWEIQIPFLPATGLAKPSKVVCDNVTSVYIEGVTLIGRIDDVSMAKVRQKLSSLLGL